MSLEGNSNSEWYGAIYLPKALFKYEGNSASEIFGAQIVAWRFDVGGNGTCPCSMIRTTP